MSRSGFDNQNLFEEKMALQCEVKSLKRRLEEFQSGKRYQKIQETYRSVISGFIKEINRLKKELADAHAQAINQRNIWLEQCNLVWEEKLTEVATKNETIRQLEDKIWKIKFENDEKNSSMEAGYEEKLHEKDLIIDELKKQLAHAEALLGRDSTNTNLPTGQTPPGKKKYIPNSRRGSGKSKGGQPGHKKHILEKPPAEEITDEIDHELKDGECCPRCDSDKLSYTGDYEERYETDIEVIVKKKLHKYWLYRCNECGELVRTGIDPNLWAQCQYGSNTQALALSLMNTTNASINKVPLVLSGLTKDEISPSEGYISKLMKRAAKNLEPFMEDLFKALIERKLLYWDDTVIMINKKRGCLRFYGDEKLAYYTAHEAKDMESLIDDGILDVLTADTTVMHDHNRVNYNGRFAYRNIECNAHAQRDLQKTTDETAHQETASIKELISATIKDRNDIVRRGGDRFSEEYIEAFEKELVRLLQNAEGTAAKNESKYSAPFEKALIKRLIEYKDNYFAWVRDFSLPVTNNLSERSLRRAKSKLKVSGQFLSVKNAIYYAIIQSYIETCKRNGLNEMTALSKLCEGHPYTVKEIFSTG